MPSSISSSAPRALRLRLAEASGLTFPTEGLIGLFHPGTEDAFPDLPRGRTLVITPHAATHAAFTAQGFSVQTEPPTKGSLAFAIVCLPRSRAEALDLLAAAAEATTGLIVVDGQKTDGIEAVLKLLAARVPVSEPIVKAHGRLAWFSATPLPEWRIKPRLVAGFWVRPGLFSAEGPDPGSQLLVEALPEALSGVAVDLGAGWGYLSQRLLERAPRLSALHLVESDARALALARQNVTDPRAVFHWADATRPVPGLRADVAVMNPPFHDGRAARPELGAAFISAAAAMLNPGGVLWLVANRHLPYEAPLTATFRTVQALGEKGMYKLIRAAGPMPPVRSSLIHHRRVRVRG